MQTSRERPAASAEYTRPLLLGYILKHLLMTDGELADLKDQLEEFAKVEGFSMGTIYTEETDTTPAAFEALIEAVNRYDVTTVVIPSRLHFDALAVTHDVRNTFERATGARVVIASNTHERAGPVESSSSPPCSVIAAHPPVLSPKAVPARVRLYPCRPRARAGTPKNRLSRRSSEAAPGQPFRASR
ncbi:hypothetical protein [Kribbella sp. DT2]|uniref:hypothetical protein n=1 Tax=Kribbella sp. DT2 TaxID=3393427 RepID=UPI003CE8AD55